MKTNENREAKNIFNMSRCSTCSRLQNSESSQQQAAAPTIRKVVTDNAENSVNADLPIGDITPHNCLLYTSFTELFYFKENEEFDARYPASFLIGTSYKDVYMLMDIFCEQKRIESRTMQLSDTIFRMEIPYQEKYGKGITVLFSFVKGGEMYSEQVLSLIHIW